MVSSGNKDDQQVIDPSVWDKIASWSQVKQDLIVRLQTLDKFDQSITLHHGLELQRSLRHSGRIRCMNHFTSTSGEVFMTHYRHGAANMLCSWTVSPRDDYRVKTKRFNTKNMFSKMIFIPDHRVYIAFCVDLRLQVFTDSKTNCQERSCITCTKTLHSMVYNKETDELIAGSIGGVFRWLIKGAERGEPPRELSPFETTIGEREWVTDVRMDYRNKHVIALCGVDICLMSYETNKQVAIIDSKHVGSLTCCIFYNNAEYFITGGKAGRIKVWNTATFRQVHEFVGHFHEVTALQIHRTEPFLVSSSLDKTVQIWRMDIFQHFMRLDVGEMIISMKLLCKSHLYCHTLNNIFIYCVSQFYNIFAPVESCAFKLERFTWPGFPSRILVSTEDGSVRLLSPITGLALTIVYPMPTFEVMTRFVYDRPRNILYTLLCSGRVLLFDCSLNPSVAMEAWKGSHGDDQVLSFMLINVHSERSGHSSNSDTLIFAGHKDGQISLMSSRHFVMSQSIQAHEGSVISVEEPSTSNAFSTLRNTQDKFIISLGSEGCVKIWKIEMDFHKGNVFLSLQLRIKRFRKPVSVHMLDDVILLHYPGDGSLVMLETNILFEDNTVLECRQEMFVCKDDAHSQEITAFACCPELGIVATASLDGYVKFWDLDNQLIRELHFGKPLRSVCFANERGDLLVGYENHVCSVPIINYLPSYILEETVNREFTDDSREEPMTYDHQVNVWFDESKLPTFSTDFCKRKRQLTNRTLRNKKRDAAAKKSQIDVKALENRYRNFKTIVTVAAALGADLSEQKACLREVQMDDDERRQLAADLEVGDDIDDDKEEVSSSDGEDESVKKDSLVDVCDGEESGSEKENEDKLLMVKSVVDKFLPRKHIHRRSKRPGKFWPIAPDGYIPNSVVRKILGYVPREPTPVKEMKLRALQLAEKPAASPLSSIRMMMSDTTIEEATEWPDLDDWSVGAEIAKSVCGTQPPTKMKVEKLIVLKQVSEQDQSPQSPRTPNLADYEIKSATTERPDMDFEAQLRQSMAGKRKQVQQKLKQKEKRITQSKSPLEELLDKITKQKWCPKDLNLDVTSMVKKLISLLITDEPDEFGDILAALLEIKRQAGLLKDDLARLLDVLAACLAHSNSRIRHSALNAIAQIGVERKDIIIGLLHLLIDTEANISEAAQEVLNKLVGITNKDALMDLFDTIGLMDDVSFRGFENETLDDLRKRRADERHCALPLHSKDSIDILFQRVDSWITSTEAGVYSEEDVRRLTKTPALGKELPARRRRKSRKGSIIGMGDKHAEKSGSPTSPSSPQARRTSIDMTGSSQDPHERRKHSILPDTTASPCSSVSPRFQRRAFSVFNRTPEMDNLREKQDDNLKATVQEEVTEDKGKTEAKDEKKLKKDSKLSSTVFSPKKTFMYAYYARQDDDKSPVKDLSEKTPEQDTGRASRGGSAPGGRGSVASQKSDRASSTISQKSGRDSVTKGAATTDHINQYDSGIGREFSEQSGFMEHEGGGADHHPLSPVKSEIDMDSAHESQADSEGWREFLDQTAEATAERKKHYYTLGDIVQMKLGSKDKPIVPPVTYLGDQSMYPVDTGTRLLKKVQAHATKWRDGSMSKTKLLEPDEITHHKIEPLPAKLSSHLRDESGGISEYGRLRMEWLADGTATQEITGVGNSYFAKKPEVNANKLPSIQQRRMSMQMDGSPQRTKYSRRRPRFNEYRWQHPLPAAPSAFRQRKVHDDFCDYFKFSQRGMQNYISHAKDKMSLPSTVRQLQLKTDHNLSIVAPGKTAVEKTAPVSSYGAPSQMDRQAAATQMSRNVATPGNASNSQRQVEQNLKAMAPSQAQTLRKASLPPFNAYNTLPQINPATAKGKAHNLRMVQDIKIGV